MLAETVALASVRSNQMPRSSRRSVSQVIVVARPDWMASSRSRIRSPDAVADTYT